MQEDVFDDSSSSTDGSFISSDSFNSTYGSSSGGGSSDLSSPQPKNNRYTIIRVIGKGGFGTVYLANDSKFPSEPVAIKKMVCETAEDLNNAMKEVWSVRSLSHDNLVNFRDVFFEQGPHYQMMCIVMEYYCDGDLQQQLKWREENNKQYYSEGELLNFMKQLASGIHYLHERKIMHRDIKPMNVFMKGSTLKIGDFGLAKNVEQTNAKTTAGTSKYMAPELFVKEDSYNLKADIWSLGLSFYEMMLLKMDMLCPYLEVFRNRKFYADIERKLLSVHNYSKELVDMVIQCLEVDEETRLSAQQVLERLNTLIHKREEIEKYNTTFYKSAHMTLLETQYMDEESMDAAGRIWHDSAQIGDTIYVFGGQAPGVSTFTNTLRCIRVTGDTTAQVFSPENVKNMESVKILAGHRMVAIGEKLYVFGGVERHGDCYSNTLYQYDSVVGEWSVVELNGDTLPAVEGHTMNVRQFDDHARIYIHAGCYGRFTNDMYVINTKTWECRQVDYGRSEEENIPHPRYYHTSVFYDNKLYTLAGYFNHGRSPNTHMYIFCTNSERWLTPIELPEDIYPDGNSELYSVLHGDNMVVFGGRVGAKTTTVNTLTVFNLKAQRWTTLNYDASDDLVLTRGGHSLSLVPSSGKIVLVGGSRVTAQNDFVLIDLQE